MDHHFVMATNSQITDDFSRFRWSNSSTKDEAFTAVADLFTAASTHFGSAIQELQLDSGTKFDIVKLQNLLADKGCHLIPSAPYHHEQNGIAECTNGLVTQRSQALLINSHLPKELWPESINAAIHVINRLPTIVNLEHIFVYSRFMNAM